MDKAPPTQVTAGPDGFTVAAIITALVVIGLTFVIFSYLKSRANKSASTLFCGLSNAGKTALFGKMVNPMVTFSTYVSMFPNTAEIDTKRGKRKLVDYPGLERFRNGMLFDYFDSGKSPVAKIAFVLDSEVIFRTVKENAEMLYDIMLRCNSSNKLLICCHKSDVSQAEPKKKVADKLAEEFVLINKSRHSALSSTEGAGAGKKTLFAKDGTFSWESFPFKIDWLETSIYDDSFRGVRDWITTA
ncbi:unnamed protein product, partial [Mesorhabditis spiculigera]